MLLRAEELPPGSRRPRSASAFHARRPAWARHAAACWRALWGLLSALPFSVLSCRCLSGYRKLGALPTASFPSISQGNTQQQMLTSVKSPQQTRSPAAACPGPHWAQGPSHAPASPARSVCQSVHIAATEGDAGSVPAAGTTRSGWPPCSCRGSSEPLERVRPLSKSNIGTGQAKG